MQMMPPRVNSSSERQTLSRRGYTLLHSFGNGLDGDTPEASLIEVNGRLYGTTSGGGVSKYGVGTVFSITTSGDEKVLHSFGRRRSDGGLPRGALINVNGTLYGTTADGGAYNDGTYYSITKRGKVKLLYSFGGSAYDAVFPSGTLIFVNGRLYGTAAGGVFDHGTVFSVSLTGTEKVLYSLGSRRSDASVPIYSLTRVNDRLYGTTHYGGTHGGGTVFSINTAGTDEKVLHSFNDSRSDGGYPEASLIGINGTLYGTTAFGGECGEGTVFSISTSGTEKMLYSFGSFGCFGDGQQPNASLIDVNGQLYGTTPFGGTGWCGGSYEQGEGTVFKIRTDGTGETTLHNFHVHCRDGSNPVAALYYFNGLLYGTAQLGGRYDGGVIFALKP